MTDDSRQKPSKADLTEAMEQILKKQDRINVLKPAQTYWPRVTTRAL